MRDKGDGVGRDREADGKGMGIDRDFSRHRAGVVECRARCGRGMREGRLRWA